MVRKDIPKPRLAKPPHQRHDGCRITWMRETTQPVRCALPGCDHEADGAYVEQLSGIIGAFCSFDHAFQWWGW